MIYTCKHISSFRLEMRQKYFHINTNFNLVISNYIPCLLKYNQNVNSRFNHCFCSIIDKSKSPGVQTVAASTPLRWKSKLHLIAKTTIVSKSKRIYIHTHSFSPIFKIILIILRICGGINHFAEWFLQHKYCIYISLNCYTKCLDSFTITLEYVRNTLIIAKLVMVQFVDC